jgi:hypothetical protein
MSPPSPELSEVIRKEMQISEVLVRPEGPNSLDALLMNDLGGHSDEDCWNSIRRIED